MITVDNLLLEIVNSTSPTIEEIIVSKDSRVLRSLASSITNHFFITENQSRLLLKILRENRKKLGEISENLNQAIDAPLWSRSFRQIEQVRKLYISNNDNGEPSLTIEFTFNSEIRKILSELAKKCENLIITSNSKIYSASLTEQNLVMLVEALTPLNFEIDDVITNHYNTIKSWSETEIRDQFLLTNITNLNFHKHITEDLGISTSINDNIIADRSVRYQYFTEIAKKHGDTLTETMANRNKPKIWVDKNQHTLTEVIGSLNELKRLPILIVFDTLVNSKYNTNLHILSEALENNRIFEKIGVYFRLPNDESGKQFNQFIAQKHYNYNLTNDTNVACVQSGKLPKFFLTNAWKPMSIIALDSRMGLRHGKTATYANCCDCVIEWSDEPTLADQMRIKTL
jgi:hypothetical protein